MMPGWLRSAVRFGTAEDHFEEVAGALSEDLDRLGREQGPWAVRRHQVREALGFVMVGVFERLGRWLPRAGTAVTNGIRSDVRSAFRSLTTRPAMPILAITTLALGIGGSTAVFTVVDQAVLRPLDYPDAQELHALRLAYRGDEWWSISPAEGLVFRESGVIESLGWLTSGSSTLVGTGEPELIATLRVSYDLMPTLGVAPMIGRGFDPSEEREGSTAAVLVTGEFWRSRLGGDPGVLGTTLSLDGIPHSIVGVLPSPSPLTPFGEHQVVVPFLLGDDAQLNQGRTLQAVVRIPPTSGVRTVSRDLTSRLGMAGPDSMVEGWAVQPVQLRDELVAGVQAALWTLLAAVGCVLAMGCLNVCNLLLARGSGRGPELGIRAALGATRGRLVRQLLTESLLLGAAGGALGLILGPVGLDLAQDLSPDSWPVGVSPSLNLRAAAFATLLSVAAGLAFGTVPALRASPKGVGRALRSTSGGSSRDHGRFGSVLIVIEVAFLLTLVTGGVLVSSSVHSLGSEDPGFDLDRLVVAEVAMPLARFPSVADQLEVSDKIVRGLEAVPGVTAVASVTNEPFGGGDWTAFHVVDGGEDVVAGQEPTGGVEMIGAGYFETLGVQVLAGREFDDGDVRSERPIGIVNQALVDRYWPDINPLGRSIRYGPAGSGLAVDVVGVVQGVQYGFGEQVRPRLYLPESRVFAPQPTRTFVVRSAGEKPEMVLSDLRTAVGAVDSQLAIVRVVTARSAAAGSLAAARLQATLLGLFGLVGLLLGLVGVYGVVSHAVRQRRVETGVRLALGARRPQVLLGVVRMALGPAGAGALVGVAGSVLLGSFGGSRLYGVDATDPFVLGSVAACILGIAAIAALEPALRAALTDPATVLREE